MESNWIRGNLPCEHCGSSDAVSEYSDHYFRFSCNRSTKKGDNQVSVQVRPKTPYTERVGAYEAINDRRLSVITAKKFDITQANGKHYYHYHDAEGNVIGCKVRDVATKSFYAKGDISGAGLFGQKACRGSGKYITITEGELDAAAVSEMFDNKYDVVSLKTGASGASRDIKQNLEFLEGYENIVLCFDNDEAGKKAVQSVLHLFSPGKVKVCTLPLKDASDMLKANRVRDFVKAFWDAKAFHPVGILSFSDSQMWDAFTRRGTEEITPFPTAFAGLNHLMNGGIASGEVTVIGALTSIGKTTMVYNLLYGMMTESNKRIGCCFLESDKGETVEKILSQHIGQNISIVEADKRDYATYRKAYEEIIQDDKLHILDHHGSSDIDVLFNKIRYLAVGLDCEVIIIDPLQAAVTSNENGMIDAFMDRLLKLTKETGTSIIVVSHLRKPSSNDPHAVSEYDTKGSGSINQIAFNTILLSRDKMSEDPVARNSTKIQLVKCRRTGNTGVAGWMSYETETGRMVPTDAPEVQHANEIEEF